MVTLSKKSESCTAAYNQDSVKRNWRIGSFTPMCHLPCELSKREEAACSYSGESRCTGSSILVGISCWQQAMSAAFQTLRIWRCRTRIPS
jgi:hypothetical protein